MSSSHAQYWWPRRKVKEDGSDEVSAIDESDANQVDRTRCTDAEHSRRIHIVGIGSVGTFVAHSLASIPNRPPITLLFHRRDYLRSWEESDHSLRLTTHGMTETRRGFEVELLRRLERDQLPREDEKSRPTQSSLKAAQATKDPLVPGADDATLPTDSSLIQSGENEPATLALKESGPFEDGDVSRRKMHNEAELGPNHIDSGLYPQSNEPDLDPRPEDDVSRAAQPSQDYESVYGSAPNVDDDESIIYHLIVTVKAPHTVRAIQKLAHRLTQESTILFLQNGMGIIDDVNENLFPDEEYRPNYMIGVLSHGVYPRRAFDVVHAGEGTIALGLMPRLSLDKSTERMRLDKLPASARYLLRTMTRTPVFVAVGFAPTELLQLQLDKLAVNAIVNPLTAVLDCKNGQLLKNFHFTRVMRLLLAEISIVIRSLPELRNVPNVNMRFDTVRLEALVISIANRTADNKSSMLQDVRAGRQTEIDYINGYIVKRGEEMGIHCVANYMMMHLVQGRKNTSQKEQTDLLPVQGGGE